MNPTPAKPVSTIVVALFMLLSVSHATSRAAAAAGTAPPGVAPTAAPTAGPGSPAIATSMIVNGDLETNSYPLNGCFFNQANATINANVSGITAFGESNEIDATKSPTECLFGGPPQSGLTKFAIHRRGPLENYITDAFSFSLTGPVVAGNVYTLTFYAWAISNGSDPDIGMVDVGLSNDPAAFGTLVYTSPEPSTSSWTLMSTSFVAPVNATHLTVRIAEHVQAWIYVDTFALEPGGATELTNHSWGTLKTLYRD